MCNFRIRANAAIAAAAFCIALTAPALRAQNSYFITELKPSLGDTESGATALAYDGTVGGYSQDDIATTPVVWSDLATTNRPSIPTDPKADAQWTSLPDPTIGLLQGNISGKPTAWRYLMGLTPLSAGPPQRGAVARAINLNGRAVGHILNADQNPAYPDHPVAVVWRTDQPDILPKPTGVKDSSALAINLNNYAAGYLLYTNGVSQAIIWKSISSYTLLKGLGGTTYNYATAINDNNELVGSSSDSRGVILPAHWPANQTNALPYTAPPLYPYGQANAINNNGTAVGFCSDDPWLVNDVYAARFQGSHGDRLQDLIINTNGWTIDEAVAINDAGQILGYGTIYGQPRSFLLTPADSKTNQPPTVAVSSTTPAGTNVILNITAQDTDGYVSSVALFDTTQPDYPIGILDAAPFTFTIPAGTTTYTIVTKDNFGGETRIPVPGVITPTVSVTSSNSSNITLQLNVTSGVVLQYSPNGTLWLDVDASPLSNRMVIPTTPYTEQFRLVTRSNTAPQLTLFNQRIISGSLWVTCSSTNGTMVMSSTDLVHWTPVATNQLEVHVPITNPRAFLKLIKTSSWHANLTFTNYKLVGHTFSATPSSTNNVVTWFSTDMAHWVPIATNSPTVSITTNSPAGFFKATQF